ncbi:MAG: GGDEF domain-containing protein [Chromatiales bacterium]|jgi:diguanylate cyclase
MTSFANCLQFDLTSDTVTWSDTAIAFLQKHDIVVNPVCFIVAYEYARGRRGELRSRIDQYLDSGKPLNAHVLRDLFEELCLNHGEDQADGYIADLQQLLFQVLEGVSSASHGAENYHEILQRQASELHTNPDLADLKRIAANLLDATSRAIEDSDTLREHLHKAEENAARLQQQVEQLQEEAARDALTGLYNRNALSRKLNELLDESETIGYQLSVLMMDIDHFKLFNDHYGHPIGDQVIRRVSDTMLKVAREDDFAARYGGEEFTILLPNTSLDDAVEIAGRVNRAIAEITLIKRNTKERLPNVTVSLGAACFRPGDTDDSLLSRADRALYLAKQTGRNRVMTETELLH